MRNFLELAGHKLAVLEAMHTPVSTPFFVPVVLVCIGLLLFHRLSLVCLDTCRCVVIDNKMIGVAAANFAGRLALAAAIAVAVVGTELAGEGGGNLAVGGGRQ